MFILSTTCEPCFSDSKCEFLNFSFHVCYFLVPEVLEFEKNLDGDSKFRIAFIGGDVGNKSCVVDLNNFF